jgi:hypothetical protein
MLRQRALGPLDSLRRLPVCGHVTLGGDWKWDVVLLSRALTVWIDVFQLDQYAPDMQAQLLQSEAEYLGAEEHIIIGTSTVGYRAWCLHEAATLSLAVFVCIYTDREALAVLTLV